MIDDLLVKYLLSEASASEQEQVNQWLNDDASNVAYFDQVKKIWENSVQLAATSTVDEKKAWERFRQRIGDKKVSTRTTFLWLKIAAAAILIGGTVVLGYWIFGNEKPMKELTVVTQQSVLKDTLSDGSVVTLNKRSSISYPSRFRGNTRTVLLKGEAFFNITPDKKKPFIIHVNDAQVKVVGTSFNIREENGKTEVIVETGIVQVTHNGKTIELRPNEKMEIAARDSIMKPTQVKDHLYNYYRTKEFVCDGTPLWKLVNVVNDAYDVHIVFGREELKNLPMNATFNNESLDQVLNIISLTFGIKVTKKGDSIMLE